MTNTEIFYSPLSMNQGFKVSLAGDNCTAKSDKDLYLQSKIKIAHDLLTFRVETSTDTNPEELLLIQLEFLLGHKAEIREVELENAEIKSLGNKFLRSEFFQLPAIWHHLNTYKIKPEKWTETNGREHPVRPLPHQGCVYRRFIPQLGKTLSFRLIKVTDLDTFHDWHNQPRVSFFWELNKPKDELKAYIEKGLTDPHQIPMIVEIDNEPVGYFEMYWVREDRLGPFYESDAFDRGFHFLIGNKKFLGHLITDSIIKSCLHFLFLDDPRTRRVMAEPRHDNQKVLKYAEESIGWRKVKIFDFPHKRAWLLENSREHFFGRNAL